MEKILEKLSKVFQFAASEFNFLYLKKFDSLESYNFHPKRSPLSLKINESIVHSFAYRLAITVLLDEYLNNENSKTKVDQYRLTLR